MVLSDRDILAAIESGRVVIDPFEPSHVQPASVDVRLAATFLVFRNTRRPYIDVRADQRDLTEAVTATQEQPFILHPGEFVLGSTLERISVPDDLVATLEGKSSLGRLGLVIHSQAGYIDPGWVGTITLELSNVNTLPITLYPGMKIGQLSFLRLTSPVIHPYGSPAIGSKYQGQSAPTPSRIHQDFTR